MRRARKGASGAFPAERGPFSRRMRGHHRSGHPEAAQGQSRPDVPRAAQPGGESADGARHCRSELPSSRLPIVAPSVRARWATVRAPLATASAEHDVLAYMAFGESLRLTLHSTNPLERVNKEIKRRTNVLGVRRENSAPRCFLILLPNREAVIRLVGAFATGREPVATSWLTAGTERRMGRIPPLHAGGKAGRRVQRSRRGDDDRRTVNERQRL